MKDAGADAVKLQTYTPDTLTIDHCGKYFKIGAGTAWDGKTLYELYKEAYTPWEWQPALKKKAESLGMMCFSTPFDRSSVDFLERMKVPMYKIASFEITDIPLIEYAASKGKPVLLSTGMSSRAQLADAVAACYRMGNRNIGFLKCTSSYPAPLDEVNLRMVARIRRDFRCVTGISDHTLGSDVAVASVGAGACIIEKHFILDRKLGGPDASFSMEPAEFRCMVDSVRNAERAMGRETYALSRSALRNRIFCRSLFAVEDIRKGELFTKRNVRSIRPGYGLPPKMMAGIIGARAMKDIRKGTPLCKSMIGRKVLRSGTGA